MASRKRNARPTRKPACTRRLAEEDGKLKSLDAHLARDFPAYAELANPQPVPVAEAQGLLGPDEALLALAVAEKQTTVLALRRDRLAVVPVQVERETLRSLVKAIRFAMEEERRRDPSSLPGPCRP